MCSTCVFTECVRVGALVGAKRGVLRLAPCIRERESARAQLQSERNGVEKSRVSRVRGKGGPAEVTHAVAELLLPLSLWTRLHRGFARATSALRAIRDSRLRTRRAAFAAHYAPIHCDRVDLWLPAASTLALPIT